MSADTEYDQLTQTNRQAAFFENCLMLLTHSPNALALIDEAHKGGWSVGIDSESGYDFHIDVKEKQIILSSHGFAEDSLPGQGYFRNMMIVSLIRALRDVWQEKRHGGFYEQYGPEQVLMLERVRAADCDVMAVLVAWELRAAGQPDLWRHLIGAEDGDIAMAFAGYIEREAAGAFSHGALRAAFVQWYRSAARVNACDHETLNYLDELMEEGLSHDAFGQARLTPVGIEVLSCLPDKTAYLQGQGREIMTDPSFAGLSDPINQTHFAQVVHDLKVVYVQGVPFRDKTLAARIFPDAFMDDGSFSS